MKTRIAGIKKDVESALRIPEVTESEVTDILNTVHEMLDNTEPAKLKMALNHFIERIDITGKEMTINYWVSKPVREIVPVTGDLGGDRSPMQYLENGFYPVNAPIEIISSKQWRGKIPESDWHGLAQQYQNGSLRRIATGYNVSYEAVRRTLITAEKLNYLQ